VLASVGGRDRDTRQLQCPWEAPSTDLCCAVPSWVSRAALVTAVADQSYRASVIEALGVFMVSLHFIQRSPVVYSEVSV